MALIMCPWHRNCPSSVAARVVPLVCRSYVQVLCNLIFRFVPSTARRPTEFKCGDICQDVLLMHSLAKARRTKRFQSGALSLNTPKLSFKLDENGNPAEFGSYPIRDSNRLVEVRFCVAFS